MIKVIILLLMCGVVLAQNSNSSTPSRQRTTNTNRATATPTPTPQSTAKKPAPSPQETPGSEAVLAAFNKLLDGIRHASVNEVMSVYWNSPRLSLFNYNGTVTKGWDQLKKNRESSFPQSKDVKLEIRDRHVTMLGRDGAVVTCLWTQSQTFNGQPDSASGRMTLVFKRVGNEWKAVHLHTSPDKPDASRIPPSEQPTP